MSSSEKKRSTLDSFWIMNTQNQNATKSSDCSNVNSNEAKTSEASSSNETNNLCQDEHNKKTGKPKFKTPAQDKLSQEIIILESEVQTLKKKQNANLLKEGEAKELKEKRDLLEEKISKLEKLKKERERAQKNRSNFKRKIAQISESDKSASPLIREKKGRPTVEENQPDLFKTIIEIATYGSAADPKRRTETIRSIKTLDELTNVLKTQYGYNISRSGVYLRLLPRQFNSREGKRHIQTVPVKLMKAQNETHKTHVDSKFAAATIQNLELLASILGPNEVFFISQDDKSRVPIGITAANKQSPLLMHVEYRVKLPDHDWVVAPSHKLIPSVYALINIENNQIQKKSAVTYSGPTYITIRSAKHSSSTAYSHAADIEHIFELPAFTGFLKQNDDSVKPVGIFTVDGGPDENPRYIKVIQIAIHHFITKNLDALFIACNAPGRSAYNRVERRMAPLSRELSGVILPHDHFGSHLNNRGETIDKVLEEKNFAEAGKVLAEIWSDVEIDKFPVMSQYIHPENSELCSSQIREKDLTWQAKHVRNSQYLLQIVKCNDESCCSKFRSSILKLVPNRFLSAPVPIAQTDDGLDINQPRGTFPSLFLSQTLEPIVKAAVKQKIGLNSITEIPYDAACPSVEGDIKRKICPTCGIYFASLTCLKDHKKICKSPLQINKVRPVRVAARREKELLVILRNQESEDHAEWIEDDLVDEENLNFSSVADESNAELVSLEKHLECPWENTVD
ncbi:uncharacterized protein [Parasteatoda tepidariorum]|uniref:uncharacterized protein n=1 Tax=Parasteatoda tepidariorum TaxID=114398 RepID=UPI001C724984|nr:uncharacterized protein LOC122269115 [Parasteatoda tepidariorum]